MTTQNTNYYERRQADVDVEQDRRKQNDMQARVAVLEIKVSTAESRLEETHTVQTRMIDKLDQHVIATTARDNQLQQTISQITGAVTVLSSTVSETNQTLKEIATMATTSATQLMKWDTIAMTLIKVVTVIGIVVGGAWTVFTWVEGHHGDKVAVVDVVPHITSDIAALK